MRHLFLVFAVAALAVAESYQPDANLTRGIYVHSRDLSPQMIWGEFGGGYRLDDEVFRSAPSSARCEVSAGMEGAGISQAVELNQTEARPIRIAGWSKALDVTAGEPWQYSIYVDFVYTDGTPLHMRVAPFEAGTHDWQLAEVTVTPEKPLRSARLHAFLRRRTGTVWFDDLYLGEPGGANLLRNPTVDGEQVDNSVRNQAFEALQSWHANAIHTYLNSHLDAFDQPDAPDNPIAAMIETAKQHGMGIWLTLGHSVPGVKDAEDPNFPQYHCVNGPWGDDWTAAVGRAARFPFAGLSMVPDEFVWANGRMDHLYNHNDPRVAAFYKEMGAYCNCPVCREQYRAKYGRDLPEVSQRPPSADPAYRDWIEFRYDSTTRWIANSVAAAKAANPGIRTDSLICVTPLCSDWWWGPGVAWDRAGYEAGMEYATTDPYILLHNYLGDSNHWYVTETALHLSGASPNRGCGVVLEPCRLRAEQRELDPVETYGSALSSVWHGATEVSYFHYVHIAGISATAADPPATAQRVAAAYDLLERTDGWFSGARPSPGIAVLFSRASSDWWRQYALDESRPAGLLPETTTERDGSIAQKEVLSYLLRQGYPLELYYLDSVRAEELTRHPVILVPCALAIADDEVALLRELAAAGRQVILVDQLGPLDERGAVRPAPALLELAGVAAVAGERLREEGVDILTVEPAKTASWQTAPGGGKWLSHPVGRGAVHYLPGSYHLDLVLNRDNEQRTREERILPGPLKPNVVATWRALLDPKVGPPLLDRLPTGDDVELATMVNAAGETLFLAINWRDAPAIAPLPPGRIVEAWSISKAAELGAKELAAGRLALGPQEMVVARYGR